MRGAFDPVVAAMMNDNNSIPGKFRLGINNVEV